MTFLEDLNTEYDKILSANPAQVVKEQKRADASMVQKGCLFGGKPLPYFLKPFFLSESQQA